MSFKFPRAYLTFSELRERWDCTENDLREAIISGELRPAMRTDKALAVPTWAEDWKGDLYPDDQVQAKNGYPLALKRFGWLYLQKPEPTASLDCKFTVCTDDRDAQMPDSPEDFPFTIWYWLPQPWSMRDVQENAAFLQEEIVRFETVHAEEPEQTKVDRLSDRERTSLLNVIAALVELVKNHRPGRETDAAVIRELVAGYGDKPGISESTLSRRFPEAKRSLDNP
jgi:hypothetical protein